MRSRAAPKQPTRNLTQKLVDIDGVLVCHTLQLKLRQLDADDVQVRRWVGAVSHNVGVV